MSLINTEDLEAYLHLDAGALDADETASLVIAGAEAVVKAFTRQDIEEVTETFYIDGPRISSALLLPQLPVQSVSAVTENGTSLTVTTDYFVDTENGIVWRCTDDRYNLVTWSAGTLNVAVTYTHGYESDAIPADIKLVVCSIAARLYSHPGVSQESIGGYSATYETASAFVSNGERLVLAKYRRQHA